MLGALILMAFPVFADRGVPLSNSTHALLPNGLTLEVKDGELFIDRAGIRAAVPLPDDRPGYRSPVKSLASISATDNKSWVTVKFNDACEIQDELTFNLNVLWSRTENALGLDAYGRKEYAGAVNLFARALQMDPAFDAAFCLNHLLLKCLWAPPFTARFLECYDAFASAYLPGVVWEPRERIEARIAALLPGLLLARVDGKSPVEYLTADADKNKVRRVAGALLRDPVARLADVRAAWLAGVTPDHEELRR